MLSRDPACCGLRDLCNLAKNVKFRLRIALNSSDQSFFSLVVEYPGPAAARKIVNVTMHFVVLDDVVAGGVWHIQLFSYPAGSPGDLGVRMVCDDLALSCGSPFDHLI